MKFKRVKLFILFFALSGSFSSCILMIVNASTTKTNAVKSLTKENGVIPPEFGKNDVTILIMKSGEKSYDKYLIKNFKSYTGKYEIVEDYSDVIKKYENKEHYRYVFFFDLEEKIKETIDGSFVGHDRRFHIYDRVSEKKYKANMTSPYWSKIIKAYVENLNSNLDESFIILKD